jgi:hypothetical protein
MGRAMQEARQLSVSLQETLKLKSSHASSNHDIMSTLACKGLEVFYTTVQYGAGAAGAAFIAFTAMSWLHDRVVRMIPDVAC